MYRLLSCAVIVIASLLFARRRLYRYLRFLQQEEYDNVRFFAWMREYFVFDTRGSSISLSAGMLLFYFGEEQNGVTLLFCGIAAAALIFIAQKEEDPRVEGKIKLRMTERASRIYKLGFVVYCIEVICLTGLALEFGGEWALALAWFSQIVLFQLIPLSLSFAVAFLQPGENKRQRKFLTEAREKFAEVAPFNIGITGSYGKTSTKAVLGRIVEVSLGPCFWPAKGINTPMGITREIRERMSDAHEYSVVEMGAYQEGSIKRLCALTPPNAAIVTAVGIMHLERFGSPEQVYLAKSELAQAVPEDGVLVCNGDNAGARRMAEEYPKKTTLLYGFDPSIGPLDAVLENIVTTVEGSAFTIRWKGEAFEGFTPLHGTPALSNILGSFTMACALGADPQFVLGVIRTLEPVNNRLEVKKEMGGLQINDAYNSNPEGFKAALEVLKELPGERRILITPGMIELGDQQADRNKEIAVRAASICDEVYFVGESNKEAFLDGLAEGGMKEEKIQTFSSRDEALQHLLAERRAGDIVLIENDLPDLYEMNTRF